LAKIRISEKDKKEYNKLKNAVKSKIRRTQKNYGVNLENEISVPSLSEFSNRKEYNAWKQKASSFTNRNNTRYQFRKNKNGLVYTVAELNEFNRLNTRERNIAKSKSKKFKDKPFMRHGQQIGTVGDRFGMMKRPKNIGFSIPAKFDINNFYSRYDLNRRKEAMEKRADPKNFDRRLETFKENFINGIEKSFNSEGESLVRKLESIPADVLYDLYLENDEFQDLFYKYTKESYNGIQMIDDQDSISSLHDVEKIIDAKIEDRDNRLLENFPSRW
jgi:hypothetical protein